MNLYIRCHYKNSAWATNGRGIAIITLNSYRADHQSPVVTIAYRPYRLTVKKIKVLMNTVITCYGFIVEANLLDSEQLSESLCAGPHRTLASTYHRTGKP